VTGAQVARLAMFGGPRAVPQGQRVLPWPAVTADDEQAVLRSLRSGRFTSASAGEPEIEGLEREWAAAVGTRHCVAVSNGTTALSLALAAVGVGPGDEVVVPALSFIASALAPLHLGATPVFADIDPDTFNVDPVTVAAAITPRTRAIVVVHLHGLPADLDELGVVAARRGVALVEDAAQAHGVRYRDRTVGSVGAVNSFSLNVSKNLATCGEGGLVNTDDGGLYRRALALRQFGEVIAKNGERSYVSHLPGWNHKPNAIQCAFTRSQLARFDQDAKVRDDNVRCFLTRLAVLPGLVVPSCPADRTHAWHILRFRVQPGEFGLADRFAGPLRAALMRALRAEGVPVSHYQLLPLSSQPVFRGTGGHHPHALRVIEDSFTVQKAHLHPAARPLLGWYADAFEKVWQHGDLLARHAEGMAYRAPWERAAEIAAAEWPAAGGAVQAITGRSGPEALRPRGERGNRPGRRR
jgi:perosamine synthetase